MNNKFSLSFGVSLVIVGFLNIFFETTNIILFGLSVSTAIFSIINIIVPKIKSKKAEFLYIIPFVILISLFCYSNSLMQYDFIRVMVDGKTTNVLTFISFGSLFISEFLNHEKDKKLQRVFEMTQVCQNYEYSNMILMLVNNYIESLCKNKTVIDKDSQEFLDKINELCTEKSRLADINLDLLKEDKENYTIADFNDAYKSNNDAINYDKLLKEYDKKMKKSNKD